MAAPPPPDRPCRPPELMDELLEEIFLRLPPNKPARLVRVALVCKRWCRVVMNPGFRRRFRQFHRTPPMLGFIIGGQSNDTQFLPCSSFRPSSPDRDCHRWFPLDARHGRVLFYDDPGWTMSRRISKLGVLMVWTSATGEVRRLRMPRFLSSPDDYWNAVLLCIAPGCDHMECPSGGPFNVVSVGRTKSESSIHAYVYSSQADEWSKTASIAQRGYLQRCTCNALVGDAVYFPRYQNLGILEYDLVKKELSLIGLPPICDDDDGSIIVVLMSVEDCGRLGVAMVREFSLFIWVRESSTATSSGWIWTLHRDVNLKSFPALSNLTPSSYIIAAADAVGVFIIWAHGGVVAIDVMSGQVKRVFRGNVVNIIPYMSFCTPVLRAATNNEGPGTGASNNA